MKLEWPWGRETGEGHGKGTFGKGKVGGTTRVRKGKSGRLGFDQ